MARNANRRGAALVLGYLGLPLLEEVVFILLGCDRRANNRISVWTPILKNAESMIILGVKDVVLYPKGKDGAINPRGRFACRKTVVPRHLGVTEGENMFLCRGVIYDMLGKSVETAS
jgi:hypothetical protein